MKERECISLLVTLEPIREAQGGQQAVSVEEGVLAQAFEFKALVNVLTKRRVIRLGEVVAEIKRLKEKAGTVR